MTTDLTRKTLEQLTHETLFASEFIKMRRMALKYLDIQQRESPSKEHLMTEDQIKHMVSRFLGWRLPEPWHPDNGISYKRPNYVHAPAADWPTGTNLFDAYQATGMLRYMVDGMPDTQQVKAAAPVDGEIENLIEFLLMKGVSSELRREIRRRVEHIVSRCETPEPKAMREASEWAVNPLMDESYSLKHRTDFIKRIQQDALQSKGCALPEGYMAVRKDVVDFLFGIGSLDGVTFGTRPKGARGNFWWRNHLPATPQPPKD